MRMIVHGMDDSHAAGSAMTSCGATRYRLRGSPGLFSGSSLEAVVLCNTVRLCVYRTKRNSRVWRSVSPCVAVTGLHQTSLVPTAHVAKKNKMTVLEGAVSRVHLRSPSAPGYFRCFIAHR